MKSLSGFKVVKDMVLRAVDPTKPSLVKSLTKNREKLDEGFLDLCYNYDCYKTDVLASDQISEDAFNEGQDEGGVAKYQYNDKWMDKIKEEYYQLVEKSDNKRDEAVPVDTQKEEKAKFG